jgi:hypothetical protein
MKKMLLQMTSGFLQLESTTGGIPTLYIMLTIVIGSTDAKIHAINKHNMSE